LNYQYLKIILDVKITYHLLKILNTEGTWQDFVYISAHKLYIETGRYLGILRHDQSLTKKMFNLSPLIFELSIFNNELTLSKTNLIEEYQDDFFALCNNFDSIYIN
jgi:hypothetical protein